ncbi:hypothetical protein V1509DRAFT_65473 [Lipomyces kononenkoae]
MDMSDTYYTALVLDPRVKVDWLLAELEDEAAGQGILDALRDNIHGDYAVHAIEPSLPPAPQSPDRRTEFNDVESRTLQRLQSLLRSDIDNYFDFFRLGIYDTKLPGII